MAERRDVKSAIQLRELLEKEGINISRETAEKYYDACKAEGEVGDDELSSVSGGACYTDDGYLLTTVAYGCKFFERDESMNGVDNTCYCCKYWHRQTGSGFVLVGAPLKCDHPGNRRK